MLGRYRLQRRLGAGGFATVWMAHDERLDREVALKLLARERIVGGRFEREARAAARLAHPAIVTLYEAAVDDDGAYLVSELIRGATMAQLLDAGRLSDRDILAVAISLCDALAYAHVQGVVHRDVKPSNVLIPDRPSSRAHPAKLTDFGVARLIGGDSLTRTGDIVGTAAYMAPEQAEGRDAGPPADLYAAALVTYEALTGINPVRTSTGAMRARRLGAHLPPLRRQRRDLPRELGRGLDLALRPRARERGTLEELRASLTESLPSVTDQPGVVASAWPRPSRRPAALEDPIRPAPPPVPPPSFANPSAASLAPEPPPPDHQQPAPPDHQQPGRSVRVPASSRALGATAAAVASAWLSARLLVSLPIAVPALAVLAWLAVLSLPRLGWVLVSAIVIVGAAAQHRAGAALVVALAALLPIALLPRRGAKWPLAVAAPALGMIGLAGAWPAIAARGTGAGWRRAALGASGYLWLLLAAPLAGADLYMKRPRGIPAPEVWTSSLGLTVHDVLAPLLSSGLVAGAPVWGLAAALLPWLIRGRSLGATFVVVAVWSAVLLSGTESAIVALGGHAITLPASAVAGAVAGALVALVPAVIGVWGRFPRNPQTELP